MHLSSMFRAGLLLVCLGVLIPLHAAIDDRKYDLQSAMVLYSISGGGVLTDETNLTVKGKGKLRFRKWGKVELFEENIQEVVSGAIHNIESTETCTKTENKHQYDVDFEQKKILERQVGKDTKNNPLQGLIKKGQEKIAGYHCDMWVGVGIRKCIYKGIPLLVQYNMLGIEYRKKAIRLMIDINSSLEQCSIPSFPVQKFALFKTNSKTKSKKLPKEFSKRFIEIYTQMHKKLNDHNRTQKDLTEHQKKVCLEQIGENIFEKQKLFLPQFLLSMKKARVCLAQAENWIEANSCVEDVVQLKTQLTQNKENNIEQWKGKEKEKVLSDFDNSISLLEAKMACIRSAKNITDLSSCMK